MIGEFEDDTHFCLKCHLTIMGLENYVAHRKAGCSKTVVEPPKSPLPSQLLPPDESFSLKADDFFSSLELQSSSKKARTPSTSGKTFSRILTRSKTNAAIQGSSKDPDTGQSKSGKNVWIGGQELKLGYGDNQSKLIKAVANLERRKEDTLKLDESIYDESGEDSEEFDFEDDESSDEDQEHPPRHHTGGKWKPSSPVEWSTPTPSFTGGKWKPVKRLPSPPPSHTKGKWKPDGEDVPPPTHTKGKWKPDDDAPPPTFTGSKWVPSKKQDYNVPPQNHTKGKWKPKFDEESPPQTGGKTKWRPKTFDDVSPTRKNTEEKCPPPEYTKGKWKPSNDSPKEKPKLKEKKTEENQPSISEEAKKPDLKLIDNSMFRKSNGTIQYWCNPCNRRLASKVVYERHLKSELHYKRTLRDRDFDDAGSFIIPKDKRKTKKSTNMAETTKKRIRKKIFEKCAVCNSKVNRNMIGKHMISHYHCRKGDITSEESKKMILDYTYEFVLECPFQCSICKFYCNTQNNFLNHWLSDQHTQRDLEVTGYYFCSYCNCKCKDLKQMYEHLLSGEHKEVVSVINRSVPIVIKKISPIQCETCRQSFMYNIQLIQHCKNYNHQSDTAKKLKNEYICCNLSFSKMVALYRHKKRVHKQEIFICKICNLKFDSKKEAMSHRVSSQHKYAKRKGDVSLQRKCKQCKADFENVLKLKEHINEVHPESKVKCPSCGESFTLPQDLTTHLRTLSCKFDYSKRPLDALSCDKCLYITTSKAEMIYHKVNHEDPIITESNTCKKAVVQYHCPLCKRLFPKSSLLGHIRKHTSERPFSCNICGSSFLRRNNLNAHKKLHEKKDVFVDEKNIKGKKKKGIEGERPFLCSTCGASFKKKFTLQQHMSVHTGKSFKCAFPDCVYTARKMSEIRQHFVVHSENKEFSCNQCDYKGKTKLHLNRHMVIHSGEKKFQCPHCKFATRMSTHLQRHLRTHSGAKPFSCPHCKYKCNSLDNLRKHVLSTNKHPGKCIYECKFCNGDRFHSNFAKEFKVHLVSQHPALFGGGTRAASYVAGIYDLEGDSNVLNDAAVINVDDPDESDKLITDPIVPQLYNTTPSQITFTSKKDFDEIMPLYVIPKDEVVLVDNQPDTWNLIGRYDVEEESGNLVPFQNDQEVLFEDHF
ncbi:unnamed protein product [Brassicogethes aeneus]|uniref:C2H2-type domain-containing protein n=1 Tax=Brassicogethes aeneus TaxID=1431903 RepID=A0A9P0FGF2_BRAAE|nr:unnamed protein product [Brassicogethes aeneus]